MINKEDNPIECIMPVMINGVPKNLEAVLREYGVEEIQSSTHIVGLELVFVLEFGNFQSKTKSNARVFVLDAESFELKSNLLHYSVPSYLV